MKLCTLIVTNMFYENGNGAVQKVQQAKNGLYGSHKREEYFIFGLQSGTIAHEPKSVSLWPPGN